MDRGFPAQQATIHDNVRWNSWALSVLKKREAANKSKMPHQQLFVEQTQPITVVICTAFNIRLWHLKLSFLALANRRHSWNETRLEANRFTLIYLELDPFDVFHSCLFQTPSRASRRVHQGHVHYLHQATSYDQPRGSSDGGKWPEIRNWGPSVGYE